jgi:WD40 repeat protein
MPRTTCLTAGELSAFHLGDLPESALEEMAAHLEGCPVCEAAARALDSQPDPVGAAYRQSALAVPPAVPATPPPRIGEYEVLGEIGRGGMGVVYKARHLRLQRTVALKMLLGGSFADGDAHARFRAEAEAVARLQHSHIVQIYEVGEHESDDGVSRPYFTLEFVAGGSLAGRLAGRPQPPRQAAAWLEALAGAAHYAHRQGIVHRDLKPSNVLLTDDGQPKLCDFGIAKLLEGSDVKTVSGMLLGTAEYMAPEQATDGAAVGPPADVYALGAILYAALTGRPPFQGTSTLHTLEQVRHQEPVPPRRLQPQVPRDLETICLKCLEKEPGKRYVSAEALADDLRRFLGDEPIKARRASPWERCARWVRRNKALASAVAAAAGALLAVSAVSIVAAVQKEAERLKARNAEAVALAAQESALKARQLAEEQRELAVRNLYVAKTNLTGMALDAPGGMSQVARLLGEWRGFKARDDPRGWEWFYCQTLACRGHLTLRGHTADASALAWSPDGKRLASGGFDESIRVWDAVSGKQVLPSAAPALGILALSWSPDGRRLASANWFDKTVGVWDPATGKQLFTFRGHADRVHSVAFNPDGRRLASADEGARVIVWEADGGKPLFSLSGTTPAGWESVGGAVCWNPDGQRLATSNFSQGIKIWDANGGKELATLRGHTAVVRSLAWSPDGRKLASAGMDDTLRIWDTATGAEVRMVQTSLEPFEGTLCWSPDSKSVAGGCSDRALRVWDAASGELLRTFLGHTGSRIGAVCWSPDGTRLASSDRGWNGEIKIWKLDAPPEPRTFSAGSGAYAPLDVCWRPDGRTLASAHPDGAVKTWDAATGRPLVTLRGHAGAVRKVSWSPDGRRLASGGSDGAVKLWDAEEGRLLATLPGNGRGISSLSWSPDGSRLAADSDDGRVTLWEVASGSRKTAGFQGQGVAWSPRGNRLAVGKPRYEIHVYDAETDREVASWRTSGDRYNRPVWSPDGTRIASVADYTVDVRDAATGRPAFVPLGHTQRVHALAWSPDGKQLATATADGHIYLWDAITGNPILTLHGPAGPAVWVAWSPDGKQLAAATAGGTVHVWDATPGYETERAPALLPSLDARLKSRPEDEEALRLRAGVYARLGDWDGATADAERLVALGSPSAPGFLQAGWWVVDGPASDSPDLSAAGHDPFADGPERPTSDGSAAIAPRWYLSADDPNGYVPFTKEQANYWTRVYSPREQQVEVRFDGHSQLVPRLGVNGTTIAGRGPTRITLAPGWNSLAVSVQEGSPSSNILLHPRAGFCLRLSAPVTAK